MCHFDFFIDIDINIDGSPVSTDFVTWFLFYDPTTVEVFGMFVLFSFLFESSWRCWLYLH